MKKLLKVALDERRYDLAAHVLVYGLVMAMQSGLLSGAERLSDWERDGRKKHPKGHKARVLRQGT